MLFTLEETVVSYTWNKENGDTPTEDILDSAPRPVLAEILKARHKSKEKHLKCLCHEGPWKELRAKLEGLCKEHSPQPLMESLHTRVEAGMCTCKGKGTKAQEGLNMPQETFEQEVWNLYTYFLNTFNTRLKPENADFTELKKAIYETAEQCIIFMDVRRYFFLKSIKSLFQLMFSDNEAGNYCQDECPIMDDARLTEGACGR